MNQSNPAILASTAYLPPVEWMALMKVSKRAIVDIHETYPRQTYRNRCCICAANGILDLSIPVVKPLGNRTPTVLVELSDKLPWKKQHWKSIMAAYGKSAFFMYYSHLFEPFFLGSNHGTLIQWNENLLAVILDELGIEVEIEKTSSFNKDGGENLDLRSLISPKPSHNKPEKNRLFKPYFQPFSHKHGFVPNLSVIDVLFNLGPDSAKYMDECGQHLITYYLGMQFESGKCLPAGV